MKAKVYFIKLNELEKIKGLLPAFRRPLGIKIHFGEEGNITHLPASLVKPIAAMVADPTFVETSVLYKSPRRTARGHRRVALSHGFDFAPIDFLDGETGDDCQEIEINGQHFKKCYLGAGLDKYQSLLVISHFKGHGGAKFGGALKNLGMGLACRRGKLAQHASTKHKVNPEKCIACGQCLANCPVNAIAYNQAGKAEINQAICISCSKCISVCPREAIAIPWASTASQVLQEKIAEYALAGSRDKQCFFINFLVNLTPECDCQNKELKKLTADIGILASSDPVAIDQASYDLVLKQHPDFKDYNAEYQLQHGAKMGLGEREYELIVR